MYVWDNIIGFNNVQLLRIFEEWPESLLAFNSPNNFVAMYVWDNII